MKRLLLILLFLPFCASSQIITNFAGGGSGGTGSLATLASINSPEYLTFDIYGNLYFSDDGNKVRKINATGIFTTIAGTGFAGFSGDGGLATAAELNQPAGITTDNLGNIFIADCINNRIRKIDVATGIITTVGGNGTPAFGGDGGLFSAAMFYHPTGMCFDNYGNLYIGDYGNHRVRKVDTSGIVSTVAGNGILGWSGNSGAATAAMVDPSDGIFMDASGNLYIAEWTRGTIRKVDTSGVITLVAGDTSSHIYNGDGIPATNANIDPFNVLLSDSGAIYVADAYNNRIREIDVNGIIHTLAGTGVAGDSGDGGLADTAEIHTPSGLAFDHCGNLYFGQINTPRIRKITFDTTGLPTFSISPNSNDTVCIGSSVTYTAAVSYGSAITYQWYVDGIVTGATGSAYTFTPTNADSVRCVLTGVSQCSGDTVIVSSNTIYMVVNPTPNADNITGPDSVCSSLGGPTIITLSDTTFGGTWLSSNSHFTVSGGIVSDLGADYDTVYYVVSNACGSDSAFHTITVIGCPDNVKMVTPAASNITISPNPATTFVTIQSTNNPITQVTITNLLGQTIYTETNTAKTKEAQVDISQLSPGIYLLKINGTEVRKFVKE